METLINDRYKTLLLVVIILIIITIASYYFCDDSFEPHYIVHDSTMKEQENMIKYEQSGCLSLDEKFDDKVIIDLSGNDDDVAKESCAHYSRGKGWNNFVLTSDKKCITGPNNIKSNSIKTNECKNKIFNWSKMTTMESFKNDENFEDIGQVNHGWNLNSEKCVNNLPDYYIKFYDEIHFGGNEYILEPGKYRTIDHFNFNIDKIKSFIVGPNIILKMHSDSNFKGMNFKMVNMTEFIDESVKNIADKWNYSIESMEIIKYDIKMMRPELIIFDNCECKGKEYHLKDGNYSFSDLTSFGLICGDVKSCQIGPFTVVELYEDHEFNFRKTRIVNSTDMTKTYHKCFDIGINSIKVMEYDGYKKSLNNEVPGVEFYHKLDNKNYKQESDEGEYIDMMGLIYKMFVLPNTIVIFKNKPQFGKDIIFANKPGSNLGKIDVMIDTMEVETIKILRYDEYYKSKEKYITIYEHPDHNSEKNGYEIKLEHGSYSLNDLIRLGARSPISSLKITPNTKILLISDNNHTKEIIADENYTKSVRNLDVIELLSESVHNKLNKPVYENWFASIKRIEVL